MKVRLRIVYTLMLCGALSGCATSTKMWTEDPLEQARQRLLDSPQDPRNQLRLAELYMERHDYLRAQQYLSLVDSAAGAWSALGIEAEKVSRMQITAAVRSQQFGEAVRRCRQRLELGEEPGVRELLAALLESLGEEREAERQRRLLILHHPAEPRHLAELARFYERSARPDRVRRARELYEQYLLQRPEGPEAGRIRQALRTAQLDEELARNL